VFTVSITFNFDKTVLFLVLSLLSPSDGDARLEKEVKLGLVDSLTAV
jgi:hypothetical protein